MSVWSRRAPRVVFGSLQKGERRCHSMGRGRERQPRVPGGNREDEKSSKGRAAGGDRPQASRPRESIGLVPPIRRGSDLLTSARNSEGADPAGPLASLAASVPLRS